MEPVRQNRRRNGRALAAIAIGLLSLATVPAAIAYTRYAGVDLLTAAPAIPAGLVLGLCALWLAKRARQRSERTIGRVGGLRAATTGRILGGLGIYVSLTAVLAVGVYELLNRLSG